ncbi:hypothetical protein MKW92_027704 [Papaver armeniacum]|nr:hypothetical protein MKW92_027704 [Papaver armeniacum]
MFLYLLFYVLLNFVIFDFCGVVVQGGAEKEERLKVKKYSSNKFLIAIQKQNNISLGIQRIIKSFKSFSRIFAYKDEEEEDDDEDVEMEIGLPTDVKHVAHIGWDGSTTTTKSNTTTLSNNALKDCFIWENLNTHSNDEKGGHQDESLSNTSISLRQFELAMAAQANKGHDATKQPLVFGSLKKPITTTTSYY